MSLSPEIASAIAGLEAKSCMTTPVMESPEERATLRQQIRLACREADWENIGICAENGIVALRSLREYLKGLGYDLDETIDISSWEACPVYLKFNTQKMSHYLDDYPGQYRGVLIALQSSEDEVAGTFGHFPLDLFAE